MRPRNQVAPECLDLYDHYVRAQGDALRLRDEVSETSARQSKAQDRFNRLLATFTLLLGWGVGNLPPEDIGQALQAAKARLSSLRDVVRSLTDEVSNLGRRVVQRRQTVENLAESARAPAATVDELTGIARTARERLAKAKRWLEMARRAEALVVERDVLAERIPAVEQRLRTAEASSKRKEDLQSWAGMQRVSIKVKQARLAVRLREELELLEKELRELRSRRLDAISPVSEGTAKDAALLAANEARAADVRARQSDLQAQLGRSWEELAAEQDPASYQAWKSEVGDADPWNEAHVELDALRRETVDLRRRDAQIEREINSLRDQLPPGAKADRLESEAADAEQAFQESRSQLDAAREQAGGPTQELDEATRALEEAQADRTAKEQELRQAQQDVADAETEIKRMEAGGPAAPPNLPSGPSPQPLDDGMLSGVGQRIRDTAANLEERWQELFGGGTPDEITGVLMSARDSLRQATEDLRARQAEYDDAMARLRDLKPRLDACQRDHAS